MSRRRLVIVFVAIVAFVAFIGIVIPVQNVTGDFDSSNSDSFKTITGIETQGTVMAYEEGWEDYRGWFRTELPTRDVHRLTQHIGATKIEDRSRRRCAPDGVNHDDAPDWWLDEPQALGGCWTNRDPRGGGVSVHYHATSRTVTLYMFSI